MHRSKACWLALLGFVGTLSLTAGRVEAFTCKESCRSQALVGWLANNVDPATFSACKTWKLAACYDISDPYVSSMGEVGARAYPAAAAIMAERNLGARRLHRDEKQILRRFFGGLVDQVLIHENAGLMGEWGEGVFKIRVSKDLGQTYGTHIYLHPRGHNTDRVSRLTLIGHEMCHTRQYRNRGSSLSAFGRDYFEGFARNGNYESNPMEEECAELEDKIYDAALGYYGWRDSQDRPWTLQVCNNSDYQTIYVAYGLPHYLEEGFSLVPIPFAKGWFPVGRGQCQAVAQNVPGGHDLHVLATAGAAGNWTTWGGSGHGFCVDSINAFTYRGDVHYPSRCRNQNQSHVKFQRIENPWRNGQGTYTWNLSGRNTTLKVCNRSGRPLHSSMLRGDRGYWRSIGWWYFADDQCRDFVYGNYQGPIFVYGEAADGSGLKWQDSSQPTFCIYHGDTGFNHEQSQPCANVPGMDVVGGFRKELQFGSNSLNFQP